MKRKKYIIRMTMALLLLCIGMILALSATSAASSPFNIAEDLKNLSGKYYYINNIHNYYLDSQKTGLMDTGANILNNMANIQLNFIKNIVFAACALFYYALDFNIAEMFGSQLNAIQAAMKSSVFEPLFLIGFAGSAIIILKRLLHRDLMGSYGQILKVITLFILSILVVRESAGVLSAATQITSTIGANILTGGESSTSSYAAKASGQIWYNMMHIPWEYLEFGNDDHETTDAETLINLTVNNPDRTKFIDNWTGNAFTNDYRPGEKVGFLLLYTIPLAAKSILYIFLGCILLLMQLMAVFYVILAPLVLILAMIPGYEHILSSWIRKLLESQLSILVMYFLVGMLLKLDELLYDSVAVKWGWLIVIVVQTALYIGVIIKRNELFGMFSSIGVSNPIKYFNGGVSQAQAAKNTIVRSAANAITGAQQLKKDFPDKEGDKERTSRLPKVKEVSDTVVHESNPKKEVERPRMAAFSEREAVFTYEPSKGAGKEEYEAPRPSMATFRERQVVFQYGDTAGGFSRNNESPTQTVERPRMDDMLKLDNDSGEWDVIEPSDYREYSGRSVKEEPEEDDTDQHSRHATRYQNIKNSIAAGKS